MLRCARATGTETVLLVPAVVKENVGYADAYKRSQKHIRKFLPLDDRGQRYVVEVPAIFTGWLVKPSILHKEHHRSRMGRKRRFPRLKAKSSSAGSVKQLLLHSPVLRKIPWEKFHIKDTTKGPMVWEAKAARFYLKRDGLPTRPHWLIVARNSELGLSHFEVRNYKSLRRHLIITAVSHLFLAKVHQKWRGEKFGLDGLPDSHSLFGTRPALTAIVWIPDQSFVTNRTRSNEANNLAAAGFLILIAPLPNSATPAES